MRNNNVGLQKSMALDTLGNAWVYLGQQLDVLSTPENDRDIIAARQHIARAFYALTRNIELLDFMHDYRSI